MFPNKKDKRKPTNPNADMYDPDIVVGHPDMTHWFDTTLVGHSCLFLLRNTLVTLVLGALNEYFCGKLLLDTLVRHAYLTLLWDTLTSHASQHSCGNTLTWHFCRTLLLDTLSWHSCRTPSLVTVSCDTLAGTLFLDTFVGHSYLTLLRDTRIWHAFLALVQGILISQFCGTLVLDTLSWHSLGGTLSWHSCGDTLIWHSCKTLLLDTFVGRSDLASFLDTLVGTLLLDTEKVEHSYLTLL